MPFSDSEIEALYNTEISLGVPIFGEREGATISEAWDQLRFQSSFGISGVVELRTRFGAIRAHVIAETRALLVESATRIWMESRELVPWYSGELHDAFYFGTPGQKDPEEAITGSNEDMGISLGYDTMAIPYALLQHEREDYVHPANAPGRPYRTQPTAGFLTVPAEREETRFLIFCRSAYADLMARASTLPKNAPRIVKRARG